MPFELQTRLLRVLSDGHFYRVGGHSAVKTNVRVIAATHQDLEQRVKEGVFREDLYHRLNVIRLRLPALRERREDIPMLTRHFLQHSAKQLGVEPKRIADSAVLALENFAFPGNVRQLENICHWLTVMAPAQVIEPKDLPPEFGIVRSASSAEGGQGVTVSVVNSLAAALSQTPAELESAPQTAETPDGADLMWPSIAGGVSATVAAGPLTGWELELEEEALVMLRSGHAEVWDMLSRRFEARLIQAALTNTRGRRIEAAQKLGIGRNTITRKIQELGLEKKIPAAADE
jgi:two-component system nitrogen regulation response regulator GlnG